MNEEISEAIEKILEEYGRLLEKKRKTKEDLMLTFSLDVDEGEGSLKAEIEVDMYSKISYINGDEKVARLIDEAKKALEALTDELAFKERDRGILIQKRSSSNNNP